MERGLLIKDYTILYSMYILNRWKPDSVMHLKHRNLQAVSLIPSKYSMYYPQTYHHVCIINLSIPSTNYRPCEFTIMVCINLTLVDLPLIRPLLEMNTHICRIYTWLPSKGLSSLNLARHLLCSRRVYPM